MSAFRSVRSRAHVDKFCAIGSELLNGPVSLSHSAWDAALDALEAGLKDESVLPPIASLPPSCATEALRHYHGLYARCAQLLPMHPCRWQQWHEGVQLFLSSAVSDGDSADAFAALGKQMLEWQRKHFAVVFWGCWSSVRVRLEALLDKLANESENGKPITSREVSTDDHSKVDVSDIQVGDDDDNHEGLPQNNDSDCEGESGLAKGSLDDSIVRLRRQYSDELYEFERLARDATHLFEQYAVVGRAERQWLTDTLLEREEEPTEALIRHSFKRDVGVPSAALESGALLDEYAAFEVNERKAKAVQKIAHDTLRGDWHAKARALSAPAPPPPGGRRALSAALSRCLTGRAALADCALGDFARGLLEASPFPPALPPARLRAGLGLLARALDRRAPASAPARPRRAERWPFALQRHTELLKGAVAHALRAGEHAAAVAAARAVGIAAARGLRTFLAATRDGEERESARVLVWAWVEETLARTFLDGIVFSARGGSNSSSEAIRVALDAALAEAQVRLACDAPSAAMDARRALLPAVAEGMPEAGNDAVASAIARALRALCRTVAPEHDEELLIAVHGHYRTLQRSVTPLLVDFIGEEWIDFLSGDGRRILGHPRVSTLDAHFFALDKESEIDNGEERKRPRDS